MKKAKIVFLIIILGCIGFVMVQNWDYLTETHGLRIDVFFLDEYKTPDFSNGFFFIACFLMGLLPAYIYSLIERYRSNKMIKKLYAASAAQNDEISGLKREVESLQKNASQNDVVLSDAIDESI